MKIALYKIVSRFVMAISMLAVLAQTQVYAQDKPGDVERNQGNLFGNQNAPKALEGSWSVVATFRVCQTGAAIRSFPSMSTFMRGGTMQEFGVGSGLFRGPGHGVWSYEPEHERFLNRFQFFRFNTDGTYAGSVRVTSYIYLDFFARSYTAISTTEFLDLNGNVFMTGCATGTATRFE